MKITKRLVDLKPFEKQKLCDKHETCDDCPLRLFHNTEYTCAWWLEVEIDE